MNLKLNGWNYVECQNCNTRALLECNCDNAYCVFITKQQFVHKISELPLKEWANVHLIITKLAQKSKENVLQVNFKFCSLGNQLKNIHGKKPLKWVFSGMFGVLIYLRLFLKRQSDKGPLYFFYSSYYCVLFVVKISTGKLTRRSRKTIASLKSYIYISICIVFRLYINGQYEYLLNNNGSVLYCRLLFR